MKFLFVYITTKDGTQARSIGKALVKERLAACVNILGSMNSLYFWKGRLCDEREAVLIATTREMLLDRLIAKVKELHTYEIPCIVALSIAGGSGDFLDWLGKETNANRFQMKRRKKG